MPTSSYADPIRPLDEPVIAGIAAGEVVERPASIVKELVENSLDAGASRVTVNYRGDDDASPSLAVTDDGWGIAADQLDLAIARHATSKIRSLGDLETVGTFGFRGEALASIAAVSRLELVSRTAQASAGTRILVDHARVVAREPAASRPGTRIGVEQLFAGVPARRKFLKSPSAEYALASDVLRRFALARPDVHFRLERGERLVFAHPAVATLGERLRQVYGAEIGTGMLALEAQYKGMSLHGALSPAGLSWGSARRLSLFVNGRFVHDRLLFRAVMEAYRTYLLKGRYPAAAIFLEVDPTAVDVNVHPQKLEVRFADAQPLMAFIVEAIRDALRGAASPVGRWGLSESELRAARRRAGEQAAIAARVRASARTHAHRAEAEPTEGSYAEPPAGYEPPSREALAALARDEVAAEPTLFVAEPGSLIELEVVGQVFAGYIVCQRGDEMVLIDQHAAHERVLFERLMAGVATDGTERQGLVVPITVRVGGEAVAAAVRFADALAESGWELEPFGEEDVVVRSVPALCADRDLSTLVEKLLADLLQTEPGVAAVRVTEQLMATVACHAAVRVGTRLDARAARALLGEIGSVPFAASCPHGRPVARVLERTRIERLFGR